MSEREVPAYAVILTYECDECGEPMEVTGTVFPMAPPLYQHMCPAAHTVNLTRRYPTFDVRSVEEPKKRGLVLPWRKR